LAYICYAGLHLGLKQFGAMGWAAWHSSAAASGLSRNNLSSGNWVAYACTRVCFKPRHRQAEGQGPNFTDPIRQQGRPAVQKPGRSGVKSRGRAAPAPVAAAGVMGVAATKRHAANIHPSTLVQRQE